MDRLQSLLAESVPLRQDYEWKKEDEEKTRKAKDYYLEQLLTVERSLAAEMAHRRTTLLQIDKAQKQFKPWWPVLWHIVAAAAVAGLATGLAVAFLPRGLQLKRSGEAALAGATAIVLVMVALATASIALKLEAPEHYAAWKAGPVDYVSRLVHGESPAGPKEDRAPTHGQGP
jgi:hypothetical protein